MLNKLKMRSTTNEDYYIIVQSSYNINKIVKNIKDIKKDTCDCLSFFHQFLML